MLKENTDYTLVPVDDLNEQAWAIRIETGIYTETVIKYGAISIGEEGGEEGILSYNFEIISSPMDDLTEDDVDLQEYTSKMLESILVEAHENQQLVMKDKGDK